MFRREVPYGLTFDRKSVARPGRFGRDPLHQRGVDVHERGPEQVQGGH